MHFVKKEPIQKRKDFVEKLKSKKILRVPGAYNPLCATVINNCQISCFGWFMLNFN